MKEHILLALEVTRREVRDQLRDWRILFPILFLALVFPIMMNFAVQQIQSFALATNDSLAGERMIPFLLMIVGFFPISISLVVALESFVGEKERGTIEALLNTPLNDWQLYLGKLLAATLPPLAAGYLGMAVYLTGLALRHAPLPSSALMVQIFALTTVQSVMMVTGAVVISTQATSVRAANLLTSFIVIPTALLLQVESVLMLIGAYATLWWEMLGLLVLTILLMRVGLSHFQREELLGREIDVLNLRWLFSLFWQRFMGQARSPWDWYLHEVPGTLRGLRTPSLLVLGLCSAAVWLGVHQASLLHVPLGDSSIQEMQIRLRMLVSTWPLFDYHPLLIIWWQNVRAMLLALVLGAFSFGIFGVMPLMLTLGAAGYLAGSVAQAGIPVGSYLAGLILPHGLVEIPAAVLATAVILKAGAALATPSHGKTIAEIWMVSLADFARVMIGLVIPLLLIAASIEAWVTPRLAIWLFR